MFTLVMMGPNDTVQWLAINLKVHANGVLNLASGRELLPYRGLMPLHELPMAYFVVVNHQNGEVDYRDECQGQSIEQQTR